MNGEKWLAGGDPFEGEVIELTSKRPRAEDEQVCMNVYDYNELMDLWAEIHGEEYEHSDKLRHTDCLEGVKNG